MTRMITNNTQHTLHLALINAYGKKMAEFVLEANSSLALPLHSPRTQLSERDSGQVFYIYAGEGVGQISDMCKEYDLSKVRRAELDFYLQNQKFNPNSHQNPLQKQGIRDFVEIFEINAQKGYEYLSPPRYSELEHSLLVGEHKKASICAIF